MRIESFQSPEAYPHPVGEIRIVETHISWVLLTGEYAYKIKKPVDFGFVDFATLERRKFFCEEELRLNGRLAESIYLDVVPIAGTPEEPRIQGEGEAWEYAVKMREFPQEALLSHAIENGRLHARHIDELAEEIAGFHQRISPAKEGDDAWKYGTPERIARAAYDNLQVLLNQEVDPDGHLVGDGRLPAEFRSSRPRLLMFLNYTRSEAERLAERFAERRTEGAVRECHGDMHLGNMLLKDDAVLIFDGIEFNADLRWIDVQSEIAFCVMDLTDRGRPDFAWRLLNAYLEHTGDYGGLDVLTFYLTYRALVRAKVAHLGYEQQADDETDVRKELADKRREYLDLALELLDPKSPCLAITRGVSGSGKSFGTLSLTESLGAVRLRSDVERKRLAGLERLESSDTKDRERLYSPAFSERTYQHLAETAETIIHAGFPAIVDATFLKAEHREMMQSLAERLGVPFVILDFQAAESELRERIRKRLAEGADPSEADLDVLEAQIRNLEPLNAEEEPFVIPVNTAEPDFAAKVFKAVIEHCEAI